MKKKLTILLIGFIVIAVLPMGAAAFESHTINVTADIENALAVSPLSFDFGTVFPQEKLSNPFVKISLSDSFIEEGKVDDVSYEIRQKPKPIGDRNEIITVGDFTGPKWKYCLERWEQGLQAMITCGEPCLAECMTGGMSEQWCLKKCYEKCKYLLMDNYDLENCYPFLCPFLSKIPDGTSGPGNDKGVDAPHIPGFYPEEPATGYLSKKDGDIEDIWTIGLVVPCFQGMCDQNYKWSEFGPPLFPELEGKTFGCDLWIEVTGFNY